MRKALNIATTSVLSASSVRVSFAAMRNSTGVTKRDMKAAVRECCSNVCVTPREGDCGCIVVVGGGASHTVCVSGTTYFNTCSTRGIGGCFSPRRSAIIRNNGSNANTDMGLNAMTSTFNMKNMINALTSKIGINNSGKGVGLMAAACGSSEVLFIPPRASITLSASDCESDPGGGGCVVIAKSSR